MSETRKLLLDFETEEVGALAKNNANVRKALVRAFSDASEIVRERALIAAIDLGDPAIVTDINRALSDDVDDVRIAAAQALAWYQQPRTIPELFQGLKDSNTWVRSHCAAGLSKIVKGPIWARLKEDTIEKLVDDFPAMDEEEIRKFLSDIDVASESIDKFMGWRKAKFDIEIDMAILLEQLEASPIIMPEREGKISEAPAFGKPSGLTPEVETILGELPGEIRGTLPPEDLRRLTPETARVLVDSLKSSFPEKKPKKKKKVKVKRVKKVVRKKKGTTREALLTRIPADVRESVGDEVLSGLKIEELEALISTTPETEGEEPEKPEPKKKAKKKATKKKDAKSDPKLQMFTDKYGEDKASLLVAMPEDMLEGIPEEQIHEMDMETLKGLLEALEPR
ncbi:MAG: HEAT repeat domain-containing protein [Candidatus Thorarchaeota archaeon]